MTAPKSLFNALRARINYRTVRDRLGVGRRAFVRWAMYPRDGVITPRIVRLCIVGLFITLTSALYGVTTATAHANFGPHDATYEITVNSVVTLDAGPLGTLQIPSPLPAGLGVTAVVSEIPESLTVLNPDDALQALSSDVQSYLQFFAAPEATVSLVTKLLIHDALVRAGWAAAAQIAIVGLFALAMGRSRRSLYSYRAARHTWLLTAAASVVIVSVTWTTVVRSEQHLETVGAQASSVFDNTPLEGARITGRLSGVIDTYGQQLVGVYEENQAFYDRADAALFEALTVRDTLMRTDALRASTVGNAPLTITPQTTQSPLMVDRIIDRDTATADDSEYVTMLVVTDLHCNVGMSPLITTAATHVGASIILNGGDTTMNGTDLERFCMDSFASAVPRGAVMVQSDGNHDSEITTAQAQEAGVITLHAEPVEIQGITFLGDTDPRATRIGQGSSLVAGETYAEAGARLADIACAADIDILLIHTPAVGVPVLNSGCAPVQISGHFHRRIGPQQTGQGIQYVNSSTAGAVKGKVTIGPLNGTAEMTVLRFDPQERRMVDLQIISVTPQATATVGPRVPFPQPMPVTADTESASEESVDRSGTPSGTADNDSDESSEQEEGAP